MLSQNPVASLVEALASGAIEIVDLTQPLNERTLTIQLPEQFAQTPGLKVHEISRYDERGPAWAWNWLEIGEHVGTHLDAPVHWISGRDGIDVSQVPPATSSRRRSSSTGPLESAEDPDYLLTVDIRCSRPNTDRCPTTDGYSCARAGTHAPTTRSSSSTLDQAVPGRPASTPSAPIGSPRSHHLSASEWRPSVSTRARRATSTRRSRCTTTFSVRGSTASQLANLASLPPTGALIVVAPLKLTGGTGSPVRVLALVSRG